MQPRRPGEILRVRGATWRLRRHTIHESCAELELDPVAQSADGVSRTLLEPYDRPERPRAGSAPLTARRRAWMRAMVTAIAGESRIDRLLAPSGAVIDILPYQVHAALAMAFGSIPRVLLADAVGLGKTVQAALVLAELRAHRQLDRALVLTPPGLRDQWRDELRLRFDVNPVVADAAWLREARAELPAATSPWSIPQVLVASIDFVKRPDVRTGLDGLVWDLLIVDEAHQASADTERREAVHELGLHARRVLLLTATPHAGDPQAFDALCRIGAVGTDGPIALLRRTRGDVGFRIDRRAHTLPVRLTPAELGLHEQLLAYVRRIWRERASDQRNHARLAAMVLLKRACSSIAALSESLAFRLQHLGDPAGALVAQLGLPFDGESDDADAPPLVALAAPGFDDESAERDALQDLVDAARASAPADSKIGTLTRLLRRVAEPCLVFTEYRDTLVAVERVLAGSIPLALVHGGLDRAARADELSRFGSGAARVLLATDAAGEGLNLQATCRVVVHFELPWNPVRLEQRIGRVDRIGQRRTVHSFSLLASGTFEHSLLARLVVRTQRIRDALGSFDDVVGDVGDETVAESVLSGPDRRQPWAGAARLRAAAESSAILLAPWADEEVGRQLANIQNRRRVIEGLHRRGDTHDVGRVTRRVLPLDRLLVASVERRRLGASATGFYIVYRLDSANAAGDLTDDCLVPLFVPAALPALRRRHDVTAAAERLLREYGSACDERAARIGDERLAFVRWRVRRQVETESARGRELLRAWAPPPTLVQAGLFDLREERGAAADSAAAEDAARAVLRDRPGRAEVTALHVPARAFVLLVTP